MDITKHIKNKNITVCNLSKWSYSKLLGFDSYENIESMDNYHNTVFCDDILILYREKIYMRRYI